MGACPEQSRSQVPSDLVANICSCEGRTKLDKEAQRLRGELGWSLARIARELGVAKSSVSVWVRGLTPPDRRARHRDRETPFRRDACACGSPGSCDGAGGAGTTSPSNASTGTARSAVVVPVLLRRLFPRSWRHAPATVVRRQAARQRALRAQVLDHLRHQPCVECGEADPVVLEFDHVEREDREHLRAALPGGDAQGPRGRDRALRGRVHQLPPAQDARASRVAPRLGARGR